MSGTLAAHLSKADQTLRPQPSTQWFWLLRLSLKSRKKLMKSLIELLGEIEHLSGRTWKISRIYVLS